MRRMRPVRVDRFHPRPMNAFILRLPESEGFLFYGPPPGPPRLRIPLWSRKPFTRRRPRPRPKRDQSPMTKSLPNPMNWVVAFVLLASTALPTPSLHAAAFASAVESYNPGTGYAVEFGTGLGYTLESAVLGPPN